MSNTNVYGNPSDVYQAPGSTITWHWVLGDNSSYWGFSVRPEGANNAVELTAVGTYADNDGTQTTFMTVSVQDQGGNLSFRGIGVSA